MVLTLALCGALATCSVGWSQAGLTLSSDGKTEYEIVVADDALAPEKTATAELKQYLEKVTGAEFTICGEAGVKDGGPRILVGPSKAALAAAGAVDWPALGTDGIVIRTAGRDLVLAGGRPRGTIYAVYTFLQDRVGCRWYAADADEVIPRAGGRRSRRDCRGRLQPQRAVPGDRRVHSRPGRGIPDARPRSPYADGWREDLGAAARVGVVRGGKETCVDRFFLVSAGAD